MTYSNFHCQLMFLYGAMYIKVIMVLRNTAFMFGVSFILCPLYCGNAPECTY